MKVKKIFYKFYNLFSTKEKYYELYDMNNQLFQTIKLDKEVADKLPRKGIWPKLI